MNAGQRGEWHFPQTDATVVLKEDAALDVVKDVKVTWHTTKNGDPYSEFVLCNYPILSAHTQQWTHTRSSGQPFMLRCPGSSWGFGALFKGTSVVVLRVERALYIHSPHLQFLPATFGLRVRLSNHWATTSPMSHAVLMGLLHDYISYAKEIMKIGSDALSVFRDYETNCKCIICKYQMLNACSVLFSRNGVCTLSFIHMLTFFHTHMLLLKVLMLWFICVLSCQNSL